MLTAASLGHQKPKKPKVKDAVKPKVKGAAKSKVKDAAEPQVKGAAKLKVKDAVKQDAVKPKDVAAKPKDTDSENSDDDLIRAAATKEELEEKHMNSVSSDAEEFFENVVKSWNLKMKKLVHKAVLYNVGGAQHFLNDQMDRTHERWNKMVRARC